MSKKKKHRKQRYYNSGTTRKSNKKGAACIVDGHDANRIENEYLAVVDGVESYRRGRSLTASRGRHVPPGEGVLPFLYPFFVEDSNITYRIPESEFVYVVTCCPETVCAKLSRYVADAIGITYDEARSRIDKRLIMFGVLGGINFADRMQLVTSLIENGRPAMVIMDLGDDFISVLSKYNPGDSIQMASNFSARVYAKFIKDCNTMKTFLITIARGEDQTQAPKKRLLRLPSIRGVFSRIAGGT